MTDLDELDRTGARPVREEDAFDIGAMASWLGAHDTGREFRIQSQLAPVFPYVARMVAHCDDTAVIGSEFYVMERLVGHIPRQELGLDLTEREWAFYEVFGRFRLAVICQQIYYRYHHRQTTNPAFRHLWLAVNVLDRRCRRIIRQAERAGER